MNNQKPAFAFPGGYPMYYLDLTNSTLCAPCASEEEGETFSGINWEDDHMYCDECNTHIESAYGDPEDDTDEGDTI